MNASPVTQLLRFILLLLLAGAEQGMAQQAERHKVVGGLDIHYGVLSAAAVARAHAPSSPEGRMHGGVPSGKHDYHLDIVLFDEANSKRITDAQVWATVGEVGLSGKRKKLEAEHINDAVSFGNYFAMRGEGPFRILVEVKLPGRAKAVEARFDHRH